MKTGDLKLIVEEDQDSEDADNYVFDDIYILCVNLLIVKRGCYA